MKSLPEAEVFDSLLGWETKASGLTVALITDGLSGIVASKDLFLKGKEVSTFWEGVVSGYL